jgi:hypothetical protein
MVNDNKKDGFSIFEDRARAFLGCAMLAHLVAVVLNPAIRDTFNDWVIIFYAGVVGLCTFWEEED